MPKFGISLLFRSVAAARHQFPNPHHIGAFPLAGIIIHTLLPSCETRYAPNLGSNLRSAVSQGSMATVIAQSTLSCLDKESYGQSYAIVSASTTYPSSKTMVQCGLVFPRSRINSFQFSTKRRVKETRRKWRLEFALGIGEIPNDGDQEKVNEDAPDPGQTRLSRIVSAAARQLLGKFNSARKNFPMKIFLLLLGFYTANALATILGQTGDWDVLVAGVVVAAIEGIGMLMYKKPPSLPGQWLQMLVSMINYWKAGVCLGLFVDAFKLGS